MKRNYTIDILRFVLALFIVALHSSPLLEINALVSYFPTQVLSRIAVPFFAAVAGYYFFKNYSSSNFMRTLKRYIRSYTIWSAIYFAYEGLVSMLGGGNSLSFKAIVGTYFTAGFYHLWYMLAIIYTLIVVYVVGKLKNGLQILYYVSYIFLIIGILLFGYGKIFFKLPSMEMIFGRINLDVPMQSQWLFSIFPFFMLGYRLNCKKIEFKKSYKYVELLLVVCLLIYLIEVVILQFADLKNSTTLCLMTYPIVYFLILFALKHPNIVGLTTAKYASGIASFMYFGHILIVLEDQRIGISETPTYVIAVLITILAGAFIVKINKPYTNMLI